jgi:hypothetical protein
MTCLIPHCGGTVHAKRRCNRHYQKLRRTNPVYLAAERERKLIARYGITAQEAHDLFAIRDYCCWICDLPAEFSYRGLTVDHSHITGKVRGALCQSCNRDLDKLAVHPRLRGAALAYLEVA